MALIGTELVQVLPIATTGAPSAGTEYVTAQSIANLGGGGGGNAAKRLVGAGLGTPASGTVVPTGIVQYVQVPYSGTITGYAIQADQAGSIVVDVWKSNLAIPTVANTITASAKPTLTSSQYINSTTLTGWTTAVAAGDVFAFNVNSASTLDSFAIQLFITTN